MRIFTLPCTHPEAGTDVTRVWLAPGLARIGAVFGDTILYNGSGQCWDPSAQRVLWDVPLQDSDDPFEDPDFDRELTRVVYPFSPDQDDDGEGVLGNDIGVRDIPGGAVARLGRRDSYLPVMAPDGRQVLAMAIGEGNRRSIRRWAIATPEASTTDPRAVVTDTKWAIRIPVAGPGIAQLLANAPCALSVSPNGRRVACGRADGAITVWNAGNRHTVLTVPPLKAPKRHRFSAHQLALSADGTHLAAVRGCMRNKRYSFEASVWAVPSGMQQAAFREKEPVHGVAFSPDGRTLLTARADGAVGEWDTATWTRRREYAWDIGKLFSVAFSPDGLTCAAGGEQGQVVVWDADA